MTCHDKPFLVAKNPDSGSSSSFLSKGVNETICQRTPYRKSPHWSITPVCLTQAEVIHCGYEFIEFVAIKHQPDTKEP